MSGAVRLEGAVHPEFVAVADTLRAILARYPGGTAVSVYHGGVCVGDLWSGFRDRAGTPWSENTMAPSFSTTRGVAATLVHVLVDRGLLDYDARVADYWPQFARNGKAKINVRHVLAHADHGQDVDRRHRAGARRNCGPRGIVKGTTTKAPKNSRQRK
jgi:CubicO group peptidase (beta-lactamase class C family)